MTVPHVMGKKNWPNNPYEGKWRHWYVAISDWMIQNPGGTFKACAAALHKTPTCISMIINSDLFRDYHAERRRVWQEQHDIAIRDKLTRVAEQSLDNLFETLELKKTTVPLAIQTEIVSTVLDRLGYSPKVSPAVQVNVQNNSATVVAPVSLNDLEAARAAMRLAQSKRAELPAPEVDLHPLPYAGEPTDASPTVLESVEQEVELEGNDGDDASLVISSE